MAKRITTQISTEAFQPTIVKRQRIDPSQSLLHSTSSTEAAAPSANATAALSNHTANIPLYRAEGLLAVHKPLNWTSQDVVSYVRRMLERDARDRGADVAKMGRKQKAKQIKVGHGGTLDPLATGVLVIGVGKGTKQLQKYLTGSKGYQAIGKLGTETSTLDLDPTGEVVKEKPWEHVTEESLKATLPKFKGTISQVPPLFSAKRVNGKKLYELARDGKVDPSEIKIDPKQVTIYKLEITDVKLPNFTISMEVGGGTFVRSLIRDMAYEVDSVATTTLLQRTKQGPFLLEHCLDKDDWTPDNIFARIEGWNEKFKNEDMEAPIEPPLKPEASQKPETPV